MYVIVLRECGGHAVPITLSVAAVVLMSNVAYRNNVKYSGNSLKHYFNYKSNHNNYLEGIVWYHYRLKLKKYQMVQYFDVIKKLMDEGL